MINDQYNNTRVLKCSNLLLFISLVISYLLYDNVCVLIKYMEDFERIQINPYTLIIYGIFSFILLYYAFTRIKSSMSIYLCKMSICYMLLLILFSFFNAKSIPDSFLYVLEACVWILMLITGIYIGLRNNLSASDLIAKYILFVSLPIVSVCILRYYIYGGLASDAFFNIIVLFPFVLMLNKGILKNVLILFFVFMLLISLKRSLFLALLFSLLTYYHVVNRNVKLYYLFLFLLFLSGIFLFMILPFNIDDSRMFGRFINLVEDGGSGRDVIYLNLWNTFMNGSLTQKIMGNGIRSTLDSVGYFAHNDFLQLLVDFGLIGGILYLMLIRAIVRDLKYFGKNHNDYLYHYGVLCATFALLLFLSLFNCIIYHVYYLLVMMLAIGLNFGMIIRFKRRHLYEYPRYGGL